MTNVRTRLKELCKERRRFRAIVEKFATKRNYLGYPEPTVLLKNVSCAKTNELLTDHVWLTVGKSFDSFHFKKKEIIEFDARVDSYQKGYVNHKQGIDNRTIDYKLKYLTKFERIGGRLETISIKRKAEYRLDYQQKAA